jgi:hypothetical protein
MSTAILRSSRKYPRQTRAAGSGGRASVVASGHFAVRLQAGPKVDEAIHSAACHYYRASIFNLYGCGSPTSCTFCGAVSRDDEQLGSTNRMWSLALGDYQQRQRSPDRQDRLNLELEPLPASLCPRSGQQQVQDLSGQS